MSTDASLVSGNDYLISRVSTTFRVSYDRLTVWLTFFNTKTRDTSNDCRSPVTVTSLVLVTNCLQIPFSCTPTHRTSGSSSSIGTGLTDSDTGLYTTPSQVCHLGRRVPTDIRGTLI